MSSWKLAMTREEALQIIQSHLAQLDDESLVRLAQALEEGEARPLTRGQQAALTRRGFLKGILLMGLMGSITTTGGTYLGWRTGTLAGRTEAELRLSLEIARLRGLLALYETLEAVGIDQVVERALALAGSLLRGFDGGLNRLDEGLRLVEQGTDLVESWLDNLGDGVAWVKEQLQGLRDLIQRLVDVIAPLVRPVAQAGDMVRDLADQILGWVPEWVRAPITTAFDSVGSVVDAVPEAVEGIQRRLVEPVERTLLAPDAPNTIHGWLLRPLRERVLAPWQEQIQHWQEVLQRWDEEVVRPVEEAIARRRDIRAQITAYREAMGNPTARQDV